MKWIKASERLPDEPKIYWCRWIETGERFSCYYRKATKSFLDNPLNLIEWLDESPPEALDSQPSFPFSKIKEGVNKGKWFYPYKDINGVNQHSRVFDTKEQALHSYTTLRMFYESDAPSFSLQQAVFIKDRFYTKGQCGDDGEELTIEEVLASFSPSPQQQTHSLGVEELVQDFKELNQYLDDLYQQGASDVKDAGNLWIQFSDKFAAFQKKVITLASTQPTSEALKGETGEDGLIRGLAKESDYDPYHKTEQQEIEEYAEEIKVWTDLCEDIFRGLGAEELYSKYYVHRKTPTNEQ